MVNAATVQQPFLLADLPPSRGQFRLACGIVVLLFVLFGVTAPFANVQLQRIDSFIPTVQGVSIVTDLITSSLLFAQFSIVQRSQLLVLASGFLFNVGPGDRSAFGHHFTHLTGQLQRLLPRH